MVVVLGGGFLALVGALAAFIVSSGGLERQAQVEVADTMARIKQKVAQDSVTQYQIAKRNGDRMQTCVQAGLVSAAFLQSEDEPNYNKWKAIEKQDCANAGIPK